jgi:hypothetical protein
MIFIFFPTIIQSCDSPANSDDTSSQTKKETMTSYADEAEADRKTDTSVKTPDRLLIKKFKSHIDTLLKFHSRIAENKYFISQTFIGRPARLNFSNSGIEKEYQTIIENTVKKEGVNFAGHYTLVQWGCGSPCQVCVVVDLKTGKIHKGQSSCYGYCFKATSKVLQINPPDNDNGWYRANRLCGTPQEYLWNRDSFKLLSQ